MAFAILAFAVLFLVLSLIYGIYKSHQTGSWRKIETPRRTKQYISEKIKLDNKHCSNLPGFDSRGIYGGVSGSFTDRTGKFSPEYQKDLDELNEKFGIERAEK